MSSSLTAQPDPTDPDSSKPVGVDAVMAAEREWIQARRAIAKVPEGNPQRDSVGLAFSGGGVRSATFCLGLMQAFERYGMLKLVDYLSTVSGGGYVGSSLTWFKSRKPDDFPFGTKRSHYSIYGRVLDWLRTHGSYLNPGSGMTVWALIAAVIMGTTINLMLIVPPWLWAFYWMGRPVFENASETGFEFVLIAGLASLSLFFIIVTLMVTWFQFIAGTRYERWVRVLLGWLLKAGILLCIFGLIPQAYELLLYLPELVRPFIAAAFSALGGLIVRLMTIGDPDAAGFGRLRHLARSIGILFIAYGIFVLIYHFAINLSEPVPWKWVLGILIIGAFININLLSMHRYYRNRLRDAFMPYNVGPGEHGYPDATEAEANDCRLGDLQPSNAPYQIINTTIQLVGSRNAKLQGRGGDSFILSPRYCGARCTKYLVTDRYDGGKMDLATACSFSGAAVDPNTYATRSRAVAFLMTLFNLRLGYWAPNPRTNSYSRFWIYDMLREMLGLLNERSRQIHLSDGGHFENLGLYELIARRCEYIIVVDGSADGEFTFSDLAKVTEMVRVDFGAQINLQVDSIRPDPASGRSKIAYALGTVCYPPLEGEGEDTEARILYIKSTVTDSATATALPVDLYSYKKTHPAFPDQSTVDQFFDEAQFEAYRELGYQLGKQACTADHHGTIAEFFDAAQKQADSILSN